MSDAVQVAGGLVFRNTEQGVEVLVIDDRYGRVSLPKGHVENGELLVETALREIFEETGIFGRIIAPLAKVSYEFTDGAGVRRLKAAFYYLVEAVGGTLCAQVEEVAGVRFVTLPEAEMLANTKGYDNNVDVFLQGFALIDELSGGQYLDAAAIDQTLLTPVATTLEVERLCREAKAYQFASVCVNPLFVAVCAKRLSASPVKVCTVIGFPLGATTTACKVGEAERALADGAEELDMVAAIGKVREGDERYVEDDIRAVVATAGERAIVKVILETALLTPEEQILAARCAVRAGAHFVKTSTGFASGGATIEAVARLRATVGCEVGVKASGGIRTNADALAMIAAGATRIGTSAGPALLTSKPAAFD